MPFAERVAARVVMLGLAAALSACSTTPPAGGEIANARLAAPSARITDGRIDGDRASLGDVQQRLRRLSEAGVPQSDYSLAKAQCWLDSATAQYAENDRTGYVEDALTESARIADALEKDKTTLAGYDTPLIAGSGRVRSDLWQRIATLRSQDRTLACTARTLACAEVRLVRAGHAERQTGWRAATTHVQMAEDALRRATSDAANCKP